MAATSISPFSPTVKYSPVLSSPSTLFFSAKTKAQPSPASTAAAPKMESLSVKDTSTSSTPLPSFTTTAVAATAVLSNGNSGLCIATSVVSGGNSSGTSASSKSNVQQRRQPLGTPIRLALQQRRNQYQHRSTYGHGHPLLQQIQNHIRNKSQSSYHLLSPGHKRTQSIQLAGRLEDVMSNPLLQGSLGGTVSNMDIGVPSKAQNNDVLEEDDEESRCCSDYVYTAPCEHHPSKGQTEYLVNDMFPKLKASWVRCRCRHNIGVYH
ncbi:hypothetical protein EDD21DRAFT_17108 [Dissophora ornata]|nr:hypothetical protein EDD21DRAFT_17108 [Dissophora ornata]